MLSGIEPNQVILIFILAALVLLFTEWIRLGLIAILKVPGWHKPMIARVGFAPAGTQFWYFVRRESV
jgi:hypothetical protein